MTLKYRPDMTPAELERFEAEIQAMDDAYARAADTDARRAAEWFEREYLQHVEICRQIGLPPLDRCEYRSAIADLYADVERANDDLRRAALNRGQP